MAASHINYAGDFCPGQPHSGKHDDDADAAAADDDDDDNDGSGSGGDVTVRLPYNPSLFMCPNLETVITFYCL
ncbi:unnamed protein product [Echinostoma caproni]|uniref:Uncharacterized protein n=1 Tax=Echinostoma caproni TaxID=27848 RepID=A0A183B480_9TREM|nr:unnamed protein product [Echinostoma caproni]